MTNKILFFAGTSFLDLGSVNVLGDQLKYLMETVDELNQEAIKFNKYQNVALKQCQEKARYVDPEVGRGTPPEPDLRIGLLKKAMQKCM